jgi:hypothetical protein
MSILFAGSKITIDRGDDGTVRFSVTDLSGVATDISSATFTFTVRDRLESNSPYFTLNSSPGILPSSPAGGVLDVNIPSSVTQNAGPGDNYRYDLQMVLDNRITTLIKGTFVIAPDITRP